MPGILEHRLRRDGRAADRPDLISTSNISIDSRPLVLLGDGRCRDRRETMTAVGRHPTFPEGPLLYFFVILIGILLLSFLIGSAKAQRTKAVLARVDAVYQLDEKFVSPVDHCVIGLNFSEEFILLGDGHREAKYPFSSIVAVEVRKNGTTITNTNRGSQLTGALVGGALFGATGRWSGV